MKVLVTGVKGQLGHDVVNELEKRGHTAVGVDIEEMDITDFASVKKTLTAVSPEVCRSTLQTCVILVWTPTGWTL